MNNTNENPPSFENGFSFGAGGSYPVKLPKGSNFLDKLKKRITAIRQKYTAFFINTLCSLSLSSLGFLDFWKNFLLARSDKAKRNPENTTTLDSLWETKTNLQINIIIMRPMLFTSLGIGLIIFGGNAYEKLY